MPNNHRNKTNPADSIKASNEATNSNATIAITTTQATIDPTHPLDTNTQTNTATSTTNTLDTGRGQ